MSELTKDCITPDTSVIKISQVGLMTEEGIDIAPISEASTGEISLVITERPYEEDEQHNPQYSQKETDTGEYSDGFPKEMEKYICGSCIEPPRVYREMSCCNACICYDCAQKLVSSSKVSRKVRCPYCRKENTKGKSFSSNVAMQRVIDNEPVKCSKCKTEISFGNEYDHLATGCPKISEEEKEYYRKESEKIQMLKSTLASKKRNGTTRTTQEPKNKRRKQPNPVVPAHVLQESLQPVFDSVTQSYSSDVPDEILRLLTVDPTESSDGEQHLIEEGSKKRQKKSRRKSTTQAIRMRNSSDSTRSISRSNSLGENSVTRPHVSFGVDYLSYMIIESVSQEEDLRSVSFSKPSSLPQSSANLLDMYLNQSEISYNTL